MGVAPSKIAPAFLGNDFHYFRKILHGYHLVQHQADADLLLDRGKSLHGYLGEVMFSFQLKKGLLPGKGLVSSAFYSLVHINLTTLAT